MRLCNLPMSEANGWFSWCENERWMLPGGLGGGPVVLQENVWDSWDFTQNNFTYEIRDWGIWILRVYPGFEGNHRGAETNHFCPLKEPQHGGSLFPMQPMQRPSFAMGEAPGMRPWAQSHPGGLHIEAVQGTGCCKWGWQGCWYFWRCGNCALLCFFLMVCRGASCGMSLHSWPRLFRLSCKKTTVEMTQTTTKNSVRGTRWLLLLNRGHLNYQISGNQTIHIHGNFAGFPL